MSKFLSLSISSLLLAICTLAATAQGTFIYDQQSSISEGSPGYAVGGEIHSATPPWGQSFTPALPGVDFIRLTLDDGDPADTLGATAFLNLRSGSITGPVIGTTALVSMANAFSGQATFYFPATVSMAPGTTYFFEPMITAAGPWYIFTEPHTYPGGSLFDGGVASFGIDLWFREGIIVPEPASAAILLLGSLLFAVRRRPVK